MKKSVAAAVAIVVVGAAYTASSWYVGKRAQDTIEQAMVQAGQRLAQTVGTDPAAGGVRLAISEYKRHVFSSDVVYRLEISDGAGKPAEYLLSDHLQHGPFPVGALKSGHLAPMLALSRSRLLPSAATQAWFDSLDGASPVTAVSRVGFSGQATSDWQFKPLNIVQDGDALKFSGGTMQAVLSNDFRDSKVAGQFGSVDYSAAEDGGRLVADGIRLDSTTTWSEGGGRVHSILSADSVAVSTDGDEALRLGQVGVTVDSDRKGDLADAALRYDFGSVKADKADLGSISVGAKGKGLDVAALSALAVEYNAIQLRQQERDDPRLTQAEAASLRDKLLALLASNPQISIDPVVWKNDKGQSSARLTVDLARPGDPRAAGTLDALAAQAVKTVDFEADIAKPMFVQAFAQSQGAAGDQGAAAMGAMVFDHYAARLADAGLFVLDGQKASARLAYRDGEVTANGQAMSVPEFMQRMLSLLM